MYVAEVMCKTSQQMVFCYVAGSGTGSSEQGRVRWARVKGKTENDLMKLPFRAVYSFRPGFLRATKGMKNTQPFYKYIAWLFPILRPLMPSFIGTLEELGRAMINVMLNGYGKKILEGKDIRTVSGKY